MNHSLLKLHIWSQEFFNREEGQDLVEYALLLTLIALAAVAGLQQIAGAINSVFSNVSTTLA